MRNWLSPLMASAMILLTACDQTGRSLDDGDDFVSGLDGRLNMYLNNGKVVSNLSYVCEPEDTTDRSLLEVRQTTDAGLFFCNRGDKLVTLFLGETDDTRIDLATFDLVAFSNLNDLESNNNVIFPDLLAEITGDQDPLTLERNIYRMLESVDTQEVDNVITIHPLAHSTVSTTYDVISATNLIDQESLFNDYLTELNTALGDQGLALQSTEVADINEAQAQLAALDQARNAGFYQFYGNFDSELTTEVIERPLFTLSGFYSRGGEFRAMGQTVDAASQLESVDDLHFDADAMPTIESSSIDAEVQNLVILSKNNTGVNIAVSDTKFYFNNYMFSQIASEAFLSSANPQNELSCAGFAVESSPSSLQRLSAISYCEELLATASSLGDFEYESETYIFGFNKTNIVGTSIELPDNYSLPVYFSTDLVSLGLVEQEGTDTVSLEPIATDTLTMMFDELGDLYVDSNNDCSADNEPLIGTVRQVRDISGSPVLTFGLLFSDPDSPFYSVYSGYTTDNLFVPSDPERNAFNTSEVLQINLDSYRLSRVNSANPSDESGAGIWSPQIDFDDGTIAGFFDNTTQAVTCVSP